MDQGHVRISPKYGPAIEVDFMDDGLLWLVNKTCFHPRGFALGYSNTQKTFVIFGDGKEPWTMGEGIDEDAKFAAVEAVLARARLSG